MKVFFFLVETLVLGNIFILTALWRRQKSQRRLSQNHYKYMQKLSAGSSPEFSEQTFYYSLGEMSLLQVAALVLMKWKKVK